MVQRGGDINSNHPLVVLFYMGKCAKDYFFIDAAVKLAYNICMLFYKLPF